MQTHIVVECNTDAAILKMVLAPELAGNGMRIWSAGAKSAADSLARTLLSVREEPTILVVDSDSESDTEERQFFENSLHRVAAKEMWRLCLAVPTIESCFFDHPEFVEDLFAIKLSEADKVLARFRPKDVLEKLFQSKGMRYSPESISTLLKDKDLTLLRESNLLRDIRKALAEIQMSVAEAA